MSRWDAIVVGAGVAGLAAAMAMSERGARVLLLESRRRLGGRAGSFVDRQTGETLDNCQHVTLGCCTSYLDLLDRLGSLDKLVWTHKQTWIERGGRRHVLSPDPVPAPVHLTRGLLTAPFLSWRGRLAVAHACAAASSANSDEWSGRTFADWLRSVHQPIDAIRRFWFPLIVSACNLSPARVAAAPGLQVVREGLLLGRDASAIGVSAGSLDDLYADAPARLAAHGCEVRFGAHVDAVTPTTARMRAGETISAGAVVLATPFEMVARLLHEPDERVAPLTRLRHSPIIGVHLEFDRPVLREPHAVLVGCQTHWLFRKDAEGRRVHAVMSASDRRAALSGEELTRRVRRDIDAWLPDATAARLTWSRAVKERRATFAATPASERIRPAVVGRGGPGRGVLLAGDYVDTGWPATMESAARAGYLAAAAVTGRSPSEIVPPPMRASALSAIMGVGGVVSV